MFHKLNRAEGWVETNMSFSILRKILYSPKICSFERFLYSLDFRRNAKIKGFVSTLAIGAVDSNSQVALSLIYAVT